MKKIFSTATIIALSALTIFSSCKKKDDESTVTPIYPESTVALNEVTGKTSGRDSLFVKRDKTSAIIQVSATSKTTTDMKRIYVFKKSTFTTAAGAYETYKDASFKKDGNDNYYYDIPTNERNNTVLSLVVNLNANNTSIISDEYYFSFTDGTNFDFPTSTSGSLVGPAQIFIVYGMLNETIGYRLNNIQGPNSGSFDLVTLMNKSATDAATGKDLSDMDANTATWDKSFSAGTSGTLYARISGSFDYKNATDITIKNAYDDALLPSGTQTNVATGNIYVAKLRGLEKYALIKVTFISDENGQTGAGNNLEYMEFSVKK
ncbi:hypothetical protein [uncultured Cytophaga sp.]|uniref:hypothetical protein n=1 Tax=uncultured Cytophaga sp. TaxID=160238 RepID=UPI002603143F|nr:hypothetical protein [uncultured Cytophaga sp.]